MATGATSQTRLRPRALRRIATAYREDMGTRERSILMAWVGLTGSFAAARGIAHAIRADKGPFKNLSVDGEHLHHYRWGIALLAGVGGLDVAGKGKRQQHPVVALAYGIGLALIVDEFALLLDLKDVYWAKQGRISVDLGIATVALAARPSRPPRCGVACCTCLPTVEQGSGPIGAPEHIGRRADCS